MRLMCCFTRGEKEAAGDRRDRGGRGGAVGGHDGEDSLRGEGRKEDEIQASDLGRELLHG